MPSTATVDVVGVQGVGAVADALVWGPVNESQTPNWQSVDDSQTRSWTPVVDSNAVTWAEIQT